MKDTSVVLISIEAWKKLPKYVQNIILAAIREAAKERING